MWTTSRREKTRCTFGSAVQLDLRGLCSGLCGCFGRSFLAGLLALFGVVVLGSSVASAQHATLLQYGTEDGLSNLNITSLLEDRTGLVWVGTQNGVYLANGSRFEKHVGFDRVGLEFVRVLKQDEAGRIWAVDGRHIAFVEGGEVRELRELDFRLVDQGGVDLVFRRTEPNAGYLLHDEVLWHLASRDAGRTWRLGPALSAALLRREPGLRHITSVAAQGTALWLGCGQQLCRVDPEAQTVEAYGVAAGLAPQRWTSLLCADDGTLWVRGEHALYVLRAGHRRFSKAGALPPGVSLNNEAPSLMEDPRGGVFLNAAVGLAHVDGKRWQVLDARNGLRDEALTAQMVDRGGNLWLGVSGHGLQLEPHAGDWQGWTRQDGLSSSIVWAPATDSRGRAWIATENGLNLLENGASRASRQLRNVIFGRVSAAIVDFRDHVWMGDSQGRLLELDPAVGRAEVRASSLERVYMLLQDRKGRVWVCSRRGLFVLLPEERWRQLHATSIDGATNAYAWSIAEGPEGTLWVSTGHGLFRLQDKTWTPIQIPFPGGTAYNFMIAAAPDGTLWAQAKRPFPLLHLAVAGAKASVVQAIPSSVVGSDNLTFLSFDGRGWLWVGSDQGVQVFNGDRWVQCTAEDGLLWSDTDFHGFLADRNGTVWIGTSGGLSHLLEPAELFGTRLQGPRIAEAELNGVHTELSSRQTVDLRDPRLTVHLLDTNYGRGSGIVHRYRLEGLDREWAETLETTLRFPALRPGHYRFSVVAYDTRLHQTSPVTSATFDVLAPWWNRTGWHVVESVSALLLLVGLWQMSMRVQLSRERVLKRQVASRTEELEREKAELLEARAALLELTRTDALTGLLSRAAVFETMQAGCAIASHSGMPFAVAMADLDAFKRINDTHGHLVGDAVLRECSHRLARAIRPTDSIGRYGGEEILILMPGLTQEAAAARMEQLRVAVGGTCIACQAGALQVTCSFGVAWHDGTACSVEALLSLADEALYRAKQNGRNRVEFAA